MLRLILSWTIVMCFYMACLIVQNYAARIVTRLSRSEHITPVLHDLHWFPVDMRIVYTVLLYNYKLLHECLMSQK